MSTSLDGRFSPDHKVLFASPGLSCTENELVGICKQYMCRLRKQLTEYLVDMDLQLDVYDLRQLMAHALKQLPNHASERAVLTPGRNFDTDDFMPIPKASAKLCKPSKSTSSHGRSKEKKGRSREREDTGHRPRPRGKRTKKPDMTAAATPKKRSKSTDSLEQHMSTDSPMVVIDDELHMSDVEIHDTPTTRPDSPDEVLSSLVQQTVKSEEHIDGTTAEEEKEHVPKQQEQVTSNGQEQEAIPAVQPAAANDVKQQPQPEPPTPAAAPEQKDSECAERDKKVPDANALANGDVVSSKPEPDTSTSVKAKTAIECEPSTSSAAASIKPPAAATGSTVKTKKFQCEHCGKDFKLMFGLKRHLLTSHPDKADQEQGHSSDQQSATEAGGGGGGKTRCPAEHCSFQSSDADKVRRHIRKKHTSEQEELLARL